MRRFLVRPMVLATVLAMVVLVAVVPAVQAASSRTYTVDADFDEGTLVGAEHNTVPDQLQISKTTTTYPVIWIANAGEDTVSKLDTNTGEELARYHTWFGTTTHDAWSGAAPSRTAVDLDGNCYVANRHFDGRPADVIKILSDSWIDRNGNGVMDTSYDANNDGVISPSETLLMTDANANGIIDPSEIPDERVAWVVSVGPANGLGRSLAIAPDGNLWLGLFNSRCYYELSGADGSILAGPISVAPNQPYGALVDKYGILWGSSLAGTLARVDTNTYAVSVLNHGYGNDYGIGIGYDALGNTHVYQANTSGYTYTEYNSGTGVFSVPASYRFAGIGISTDSNGNILVSNYSGGAVFGEVSKFAPDGSLIWKSATHVNAEPRGAIVDSNDDVWVAYRTANVVAKYDGTTGAMIAQYPVGLEPYTYSDATGLSLRGAVLPQGTWNTVFDSEALNMPWGTVSWNSSEPAGTSVAVRVRSSNDNVTWSPWEDATSEVALTSTPAGRYLEIQATLRTDSADSSPILYDLTVLASGQVPPVPELPTVLLLGVGLVGVVGIVGLSLMRRRSQAL